MPAISFTGALKAQIVELYLKCGEKYRDFQVAWRKMHGMHAQIPDRRTASDLVLKFREEGNLGNRQRMKTVLSRVQIDIIEDYFKLNPKISLRKASQQLGISYSSLWRALRLHLKMKAYKITRVHALNPPDGPKRVDFCEWALRKIAENDDFLDNVWFSDEAHFHQNGYVNSQNARIWGTVNPRAAVQVALHSPKTTAWCAISRSGIIGPYFFRETARGENYREMISNFFIPELLQSGMDMSEQYFQQDGATPHTARESVQLLRTHFDNRLITNPQWPPRSPDLTPPDFFLWGALKGRVYSNNPQNLDELERNIRAAVRAIDLATLQRVFQNFECRLLSCIDNNGFEFEKYM